MLSGRTCNDSSLLVAYIAVMLGGVILEHGIMQDHGVIQCSSDCDSFRHASMKFQAVYTYKHRCLTLT